MDKQQDGAGWARMGGILCAVGCIVPAVLWGQTVTEAWPGDGVFTAATVADFGEAGVPFVLGSGLLNYTGATATLEKGLTFTVPDGLPATVRIEDPAATLTVAGPVRQTAGAFIKDGPGTLALAAPGDNNLGVSRAHEDQDSYDLVWDEATGTVGDKGYAVFTVNDGRVVMGAPGQTNALDGVCWIGSRTQKSTRLDIVGGTVDHQRNWFCISRGAGRTDNDVTSSLYVSGGAVVNLAGICLNNANGVSGYYGRSLLDIENARLTVKNEVFVGEGVGEARIRVGPGATLTAGRQNPATDTQGFQIGRSGTVKAEVVVDGGTLAFPVGFVRTGNSLVVTNGGTLKTDDTLLHAARNGYANGSVVLDGATLAPCTANRAPTDWFRLSSSRLGIGADGATLDAPLYACLGIPPTNLAAGASIVKTGAGVLTLAPSAVDVTAQTGTLRMSVAPGGWTGGLTGVLACAPGAALEVSGDGVLGAMDVRADAATFEAFGLERLRSWACNRNARWRADGTVSVTEAMRADSGSTAVLDAPVRVDRSFELAFDTFLYFTSARPADGWSLFFQKAGSGACGGGNTGYSGVADSFGVTVDVYNERVQFGENGVYTQTNSTRGVLTTHGAWAARRRCRLVYDAAAGRVTFSIRTPDGVEAAWDYAVDLASVVGADAAYLTLGGGTGGSNAAFCFSNIRFEERDGAVDLVRVGGTKTLGAGETFSARLRPNANLAGFLMNRLAYADGAVVDVADDGAVAVPAPLTTADPALWTLSGGAYWRDDGSLATSRLLDGKKMSGVALSVARYPVGGNWEASFTYDLGAHDHAPADAVELSFLDASARGLILQWRYYEDVTVVEGGVTNKYNTRKTQLKLTRRNVYDKEQSVTDCTPIDFAQNGPAQVSLAYDATAKTLAVSMAQRDGADVRDVVFTDVDMAALLATNATAQVRFRGIVGGYYTENVVKDFTFRSDADDARRARAAVPGFFGFERMAGSGTLVKTGAGDLGLVDDANAGVALRLAGGGLRLRREPFEDVALHTASGWTFSHPSGRYIYPNGLQIGELTESFHRSTAQTRHRVCVAGDWRCTFSLWVNATPIPADAVSFFLHNDPRGNECVGGSTGHAGFGGIANSVAVGWYFYPKNDAQRETVMVARNGGTLGSAQKHTPLALPGQTTAVALTYRAAEKTLTSVLTQGATSVTNTFTNVDVAGSVKDDLAWLGFGVGCGGYRATPRITDFRFARLDAPEASPTSRYLASVEVAADAVVRLDTAKEAGVFRLAEAVALVDGVTLAAASLEAPATLAMGTLTLGTGSVLKGDAATTLRPDTLAGALDTLTLDGATLVLPEAQVAARGFRHTDLVLTNGARVAVPPGRVASFAHVFVDGRKLKGGAYPSATTPWVASGHVAVGDGTLLFLR